METLTTADGKPVDLPSLEEQERQFHASMAVPEPDEPQAPAPPRVDSEAPFGRKADGTPRQNPPGPGRGKKGVTQKPSSQSKTKTETADAATQRRVDGVKGIMQLGAGVCMMVSTRGGDAFKADAVVLAQNAEPMAQACAQVAAENAQFAAILDKVTEAGPYAALLTVTVPMAMQIARNHGVNLPSTQDPAELIAALESPNEASSVQ